jgi:hypothetical protein
MPPPLSEASLSDADAGRCAYLPNKQVERTRRRRGGCAIDVVVCERLRARRSTEAFGVNASAIHIGVFDAGAKTYCAR